MWGWNDSEVMVGYILSPLTLNALFYKTRHKFKRERYQITLNIVKAKIDKVIYKLQYNLQ